MLFILLVKFEIEKLHGALVRTRQEENAGQTQGGQSQTETSGETQQTPKNQWEDLEL